MGDLIDMATSGAALLEKKRQERWRVAYGPEIAKPRPPIAYVCRDLALAPGCSIFGGGGFSGKTTSLQALMLSIVSGSPAWGHFTCEKGDVAHIDFEQGPDLTYLKYQRMGRHMGIDVAGLGRSLACSSLPEAHLDVTPESTGELRWLLEGRRAAIVDAFRGAFPNAQENDSGARRYLDMVHKVGLEMGCAVVVIAHSRKLGDDDDARSSLRGSSALFDAPQTVWMLTGTRGKPTRCENVKERLRGKLRESFGLQISDVLGPGAAEGELDDEWGLNVEYVSGPDVQAAYAKDDENFDITIAINGERLASAGERLLALIARAPDGLTEATARSYIGMSASDFRAVMPEMVKSGAVWVNGKGSMSVYHIVNERQPGED